MPLSLLLHLRAAADGDIYGATGRHAHGFWLNSWRAVDPAIGDALHTEAGARRFTLSPLLGPRAHHGLTAVRDGDSATLRLTALDDDLAVRVVADWLPALPAAIDLGGVTWWLVGLSRTPADHPLAGRAAFAQLAAPPVAPPRWALRFTTPTALSLQGGGALPFPLPVPLVAGWLARWRAVTDQPLADLPTDRLEAALRVSAYRLRTVSVRFWGRGPDGRRVEWPQIGCVGDLLLDATRLNGDERAALAALVAFAFYCGSGHHTTMGFGQTRHEPA